MKMVCFDLGGVLLEILHTMEERLALCDGPRRGLSLPPEVIPGLTEINEAYQRGTYDWAEARTHLVEATEAYGFSAQDWDAIEEGIIVGPKPDAEEVVRFCEERGYTLGILSNTCELHVSQFESYRFFDAFPEKLRVYSHREKVLKPQVAAYRCFENVTGAQPSEILFFDDTLANIEAARSLGWTAFHVPRGQPVFPVFRKALGQS